jgi:phosphate:Na+ symporter
VLGANLGSAINPVVEGASGNDPATRRLPLGNLINRMAGVALGLVLLPYIGPQLVTVDSSTARAVADFHTGLNLVLAAIFFPLLTPFAALLRQLIPARVDPSDPSRPLYLDPAARETPVIALGGAAREALRMADVVETMLLGLRDIFEKADRRQIAETRRLDNILDKLNPAIKTYVMTLDPEALGTADQRRLREILSFATEMEHSGDIVDKNLCGIASKMLKRGVTFSKSGQAELLATIDRLITNVRTSGSLFMTGDERAARLLASEKEAFRAMETAATNAHFERLRTGRITAETGTMHLAVLRDLKSVNSHLVAAAAYPVLEGKGELLPTRLRQEP